MVTVSDILALSRLSLEVVTLPHPEAQVRWVATSELGDPSPFMEGGEILLTTGLVERDAVEWRRFIASLVDAGVVALGFGVGLSHPELPAELRAAATDAGLNLFVVPRPVPFIAVSRAVADQLWAVERDADREALQHQQALTNAAIGGTDELLSALAGIVGGNALLCSPDASVLASTMPASVAADSGSILAARALPHIRRLHAVGIRGAATDISRDSRMTVHPVGVGNLADAYLVVDSPSVIAGSRHTAVTMAVALLTLDRARARAERDADRRIMAGALSLALQSDTDAARALLAGASQTVQLPTARARVVRARGSAAELDSVLGQVERDATRLRYPLVARVGVGAESQLVVIISAGDDQLDALVQSLSSLEVGIGPVRPLPAIAH
ncbi:MAG TPA: PucR family transcriptional regulator ligand-binding domain-containing protein, partial [Homoserinimonas sp.]|nr:PucR family transcriptional regulator ligand-binding domain-containing protein [Homoserinimonas sp.]